MTKILAAVFAVGMSVAFLASAADAAGGCGPGWHPNRWGRCVRNVYYHPGIVVAAPGVGIVVRTPGRVCPYHWHLNRWGHCVRNW